MPKLTKVFSLFTLTFLFCFLSYKLCYFIAEKYFFDKFFYKKSITHGYGLYSKNIPLSRFGDRAKDLVMLNDSPDHSILGTASNNHQFNITIIGDSFVWGEGIRNDQRFAHLLEQQLSQIAPTEVISIAKPGWNILDYLNAYQKILQSISPNLIIFSLVNNDININHSDEDSKLVQQCHRLFPYITATYDSDKDIAIKDNPYTNLMIIIGQADNIAWSNPVNQCVLDNSLKILPTDNAIYFVTEDYDNNQNLTQKYKHHLMMSKKLILSSSAGKNTPRYSKYWRDNLWKNFTISSVEGHPNVLANQMYADILFDEITTNPKWNFIQQ